ALRKWRGRARPHLRRRRGADHRLARDRGSDGGLQHRYRRESLLRRHRRDDSRAGALRGEGDVGAPEGPRHSPSLRYRTPAAGRSSDGVHPIQGWAAGDSGRLRGGVTMREIDLLDRYPRVRRNIAAREAARPSQRELARKFGREYFDGERGQGYGGYRCDGRWGAGAERMGDLYDVKAGDGLLEVGCARGVVVHVCS